jgi:quinol monooxygenase YgiN
MATTALKSKPFAVVVQAEILCDRMDEFLTLIQTNAENTRKEPGCIRFGK